ncbi:ribonuclease H [Haloimpatiens sp. FM7330]|uniref:ribonuclease H family protein n=1 Tax=Haloimpatiens sp. FM7330 TaxID=3298610 RepID=UPI0036275FA1
MKMLVFHMKIINKNDDNFKIKIFNKNEEVHIIFNPFTKNLNFLTNNNLTDYLKKNEYQLRKLLHNKRPNTYFIGFELTFAFRDEKDVASFNDRTKIVVLDKQNGKNESYTLSKGKNKIYKMYIDGSFCDKKNKGAYSIIIEDLEGNYKMYSEKTHECGSCQTELNAAISGLKILKDISEIRIITDSQYVRKGLTEWIMCWKLNGWKTANGETVKNIDNWKLFDMLTDNKYIEFEWVKGHSDHFENTLCDLYARENLKK